jgi:phospholipid/cholesterol/gamma-HCH transport system substrate-binding protein
MTSGSQDEKNLEIKVGAMILLALAILIVFLLILGDWSFKERKKLSVYFQNPGGLSAGVAVKIAGRKIGKVSEMTFLGQNGPKNPLTNRPSLVRIRIEIDKDAYESMRSDAKFYITTKGVLGDPFLEIDPGVAVKPISPKQTLFGTDPPRLDLFLADAAELIRTLNRLLVSNSDDLDKFIKSSANIVGELDSFLQSEDGVKDGKARIDRILTNVEKLTEDINILVNEAKTKYIDDPAISRLLKNISSISRKVDKDIDPLMQDVKTALATVNRLGNTIGPDEQKAIKNSLYKLNSIALKADSSLTRVNKIIANMEKGNGTVGQLLSDEEIYDDLKEFIRDLKRHPWKLIWED